ncbi:serine/threonine protein kinase, partial [Trypanosoma grayi]|uniref:serine/threonine protein kinase n=1 Tax=Trypanosoma grayi TaxID=71804 RepID=UPI0004F4B9E3
MTTESLGNQAEAVEGSSTVLVSQAPGDDLTQNPLGNCIPKTNSIHSMPSFSLYDESREIDAVDRESEKTVVAEPEDIERQEGRDRGFLISTVAAVALVISVGVIAVGLAGFLPGHLIGFRYVSGTAELIQMEAVRGVIIIMRSTILQLPDFAHTVTANYMRNQTSAYTVDAFPKDSQSLLYSLLSVLSTFSDTISFFKFLYKGNLYGVATEPLWVNQPEPVGLLGGHEDEIASAPVLMYDPSTLVTLSSEPLGYWNISSDLTRPNGTFEMIVTPWEENGSTKRWLPEEITRTGLYFNFVIPFRINNASGNCEVGMRTRRILQESQPLIAALREHGRVMLFDDTLDVVILNSWGENTTWWIGNESKWLNFDYLRLGDIKDPLAADLVHHIKSNKDRLDDLINTTAEMSFPFEKSNVRASVARVTDKNGLNIMLSVAVLRSDFFSGIVRARAIVLIVVVGIVVFSAIIAFIGSCYLARPLTHLVTALKRASNLELSTDDGKMMSRSRILEVEEIQADYVKLLRQLRVLRKFVPEAILALVDSASEGTSNTSVAIGENLTDPAELLLNNDRTSPQNMGNAINIKRDVRLNSGIFREQLNMFTPKHCSVVAIEIHAPQLSDDSRYMSILAATATEQSGCIELLGPEKSIVSFGAHATLPMHSTKGCRFAFDLLAKLTPKEQEYVTILVESNEFLVGTCGALGRNARVLFGTEYLFELTKAMSGTHCHIAATSGIASNLQVFQAFPVDCVLMPCSTLPVVLFELRLLRMHGENTPAAAKHFRLGFAAMRQGCYKQAMAHYQRVGKSDPQAQRLVRLCSQRCAANDSSSYVRLARELLEENLPDVSVAVADDNVPNLGPISSEDTLLEIPTKNNEAVVGRKPSSPSNILSISSGALFEMLEITSSAESDPLQPCDDGCTGADDVPLFLPDMNQRVWTRSL